MRNKKKEDHSPSPDTVPRGRKVISRANPKSPIVTLNVQ